MLITPNTCCQFCGQQEMHNKEHNCMNNIPKSTMGIENKERTCNNCGEDRVGLLVPCHTCKEETCVGCSSRTSDYYYCRWCPVPTSDWEEEFYNWFPKDIGLFNTESGYRIKADPKMVKRFVKEVVFPHVIKAEREKILSNVEELLSSCKGAEHVGWSGGYQEALQDIIHQLSKTT